MALNEIPKTSADALGSQPEGSKRPHITRASLVSKFAGAWTMTIGGIVLLGWLADVPALRSVFTGLETIKPDSALAFVVAGLSLWFFRDTESGTLKRRVAVGSACLIGVIGGIALLCNLAGWDFGTGGLPRMGSSAAINFILLCGALLLLDFKTNGGLHPAELFSLLAGVVSLAAITGYFYAIASFYQVSTYSGMAPHTAITFLVLCGGVLSARSDRGVVAVITSDGAGGSLVRRLLPAAIGVPLLLGWLRLRGQQLGLFDVSTGTGILVLVTIILFSVAVYWAAVLVNQADLQRQGAQEAYLRSKARETAILEAALDSIITMDHEGKIVDFNPAATKMFAYTHDEALGKEMAELIIPPSLRNQHRKGLAKYLATGHGPVIGQRLELSAMRSDGSEFPVELTVTRMAFNGPPMFAGHIRDISGRKLARLRLEESEERYRMLFEQNPLPMWVFDLGTLKFLDVNPAAVAHYGYSREEFLSMTLKEVRPADDISALLQDIDAIPEKGDETGIWRHKKKDGSFILVEVSARDIVLEGRRVRMVLANDVTAKRAAEDEVRKLNDELEKRVEERTAELASANRELEAFTYSVSHDLRAPLRHIDAFSQMLLGAGKELPDQLRQYLGRIGDSVRRMNDLIEDLLALAHVTRQELTLRVTGLNSVINPVIEELKRDTVERRIEWRIAQLPFVECDPLLMRQVFRNLLDNAVKFTRPREAATIEIGTMDDQGEAAIFIRDNGVGFSMKYAEKLFGVFERLHRQEDFEGTGVGLAIVQRIVQRHGGRVWAEAELNKGATFYLALKQTQS
jgi:hypothetical protein